MASLGELFVTVGAKIDGFKEAMTDVSTTLNNVDKEATKATSGLDKLSARLTSMGVGLTAAVTAPIVGLSVAVANVAGTFEQTQAAFTNFLGSADKATAFLAQLKDFAAQTPFEFTGLTESAKKMMAFGFEAEKVIPTLRIIGDAVAGIGGGAPEIDRVTLALGQMQAKGKVSAQEMNQLAELGISAWKMLADQIGVSIPEAMKLAEKGAISASVAIPAILDGMNAKFNGLMEQQSKTFLGMWSNFKDQITFTLMDLGTVLLPIFKDMLNAVMPLVGAVKNMALAFSELPGPIQTAVLGVTALAAAAGPLLIALGSIITAFTKVTALIPMAVAGLSGLAATFQSVTFALNTGMVAALTKTELALAGVSLAAAGVAGAFIGWKIGSWAYENIPAVQKLGDVIAEIALQKIPYLENAILRLTGTTAAQTNANNDLDFATAKLEKSLKAHGITVERGSKSAEEYAKALREKAKELSKNTTETAKTTKATVSFVDAEKEAKKAADELAKAYRELGLRNLSKEADDLRSAMDLLKRTGDWQKLTAEQQAAATAKLNDAVLAAKGYTYNWQQALIGLTTQQDATRRATEAMFDEMERIGDGIQGVSQDIRDMPMGMINEELMKQAQAAAQTSGEIYALESAYNSADLKNKNAIYEMLRDQIKAAEEAGETVPREQRDMLKKMGDDLGREDGLGRVKKGWQDFSNEVSTIITNFSQDISKSLWEGDMSWGEKGMKLLKDLGAAVTSSFITPAVAAITGFVNDTLNGLLKGALEDVGGWFANILGGGTTSAIGDAVGGAGSAAGSATGSAGGAASGAASGVSTAIGVIGAVGSAGSMISGIIGNFQNARMETTLNAIEESTRWTKIDIHNLLPKLVNDFASALPGIHDRLVELRDIGIAVWPKDGYEKSFGGGVTVNIEGNAIGNQEFVREMASLVAAELVLQGAV